MDLKNIISILATSDKSVATAESASAGYLSYLLTKTPGSSKVFKGGIIVYSLESKHKFFKIPRGLLTKTQGVCAPVARTLAKKIRSLFNTDFGIAIVGFAGPDKLDTRTGIFFISIASSKVVYTKKLNIRGSRDHTRKYCSHAALDLLYKKALCGHL